MRYHGSVGLNPMTPASSLSKITDEVLQHLTSQLGAEVTITLDIQAYLPNGAPEHIVRTVTENGRTLKFQSHGFEEE